MADTATAGLADFDASLLTHAERRTIALRIWVLLSHDRLQPEVYALATCQRTAADNAVFLDWCEEHSIANDIASLSLEFAPQTGRIQVSRTVQRYMLNAAKAQVLAEAVTHVVDLFKKYRNAPWRLR